MGCLELLHQKFVVRGQEITQQKRGQAFGLPFKIVFLLSLLTKAATPALKAFAAHASKSLFNVSFYFVFIKIKEILQALSLSSSLFKSCCYRLIGWL